MEIPAYFQTIAEVGIGIAGFSGLVVALRQSDGPLSEIQKYRLRVLFALSFGAVFLSLLPELQTNLQVPDERVWFDSSAAIFIYSLGFFWWWIGPSRRIAKVAPEIFNWRAFNTMAAGHAVILLLQLAVLVGYFETRAAGIVALGLTWYLMHAAQQFIRMLFIQPRTGSGSEPDSDLKRQLDD